MKKQTVFGGCLVAGLLCTGIGFGQETARNNLDQPTKTGYSQQEIDESALFVQHKLIRFENHQYVITVSPDEALLKYGISKRVYEAVAEEIRKGNEMMQDLARQGIFPQDQTYNSEANNDSSACQTIPVSLFLPPIVIR